MTANTMREAFEKWYLMQRVAHASHLKKDANGCYFGAHTETAWRAWQAAQSVLHYDPSTADDAAKAIRASLAEAAQVRNCSACNGRGMVGGFVSADSGYQDDKCDFCAGTGKAAQSVPVVGDILFYASDSTETADSQIKYDVCADKKDHSFFPLIRKPATSITAQELEALRRDAEAYRRLVTEAKALGMQECVYPDCICPDGVSSGECNLGLPCAPCRDEGMQERRP